MRQQTLDSMFNSNKNKRTKNIALSNELWMNQ